MSEDDLALQNIGKLEPASIHIDLETQSRVSIDPVIVDEYAEAMLRGDTFPPVEVFYDAEEHKHILVDGFHHYFAWLKAFPNDPILAHIQFKSVTEAQWESFGVNKSHGLRRTNADKRKAVEGALLHEIAEDMSDSAISVHVGVTQPFVSKVRNEMIAEGRLQTVISRTGKDGRTINTANIGKSHVEKAETTEPLPPWHPDYVAPPKSIEPASNKVEADDPILSGVESQRKRNEFARWYKKEELCCGHCTLRYEEDGVVICGASGEPTEANGKICNTFDKALTPRNFESKVVNGPIDLEKDKDLNEDKSGKVHRHYKPYASRGAIQVKLPPNNIHEFVQLLIHHFERPYLKEVIPLLQRRVAHPEEDEQ